MRRHELTDRQWAQLAPLLPPERPRTGRPNQEHRTIVNGIVWKLATGVPWRVAGVWDRVLAAVQARADAAGQVDWTVHFVDGTVIRAHQHAAGAKGGTLKQRRSAAAGAASARRSTCAPRAVASR